ncbi:MAG: peptidylprolyl isomerase [Deltaproteobacteria bacterium]|nr:peptidylprolyl isomerase [Deltaproteobacteria bacterium]
MFRIALVCLLLLPAAAFAEDVVIDRVAAVIENSVVTERELEDKARLGLSALADIADDAERVKRKKEILRQALDEMISERLIDTELSKVRDKLGITDAQVEHTFEETARANNMDKEQLTQVLYNQGMTVAEFKAELRRNLERVQYLQLRMQGKSGFTEKDIDARCAELKARASSEILVRARHILVKLAGDATDGEVATAKQRVEALYDRIVKKGEKFVDVVHSDSDDKGTPDGDLGFFRKGDMMPSFEQVAFNAPVGVVSKPVRTRLGFHLLVVEDRKKAESTGCDDDNVKNQVARELQEKELKRQTKVWVDELKRKAFVEIRL